MGSKIFISMCVLLAIMLHISIGVSGRNLAQTTADQNRDTIGTSTNGINNVTHTECFDGCDDNYGGYGGGRDNCRYGCCSGDNYYGVGCTCCSYAGQAADQTHVEPHN